MLNMLSDYNIGERTSIHLMREMQAWRSFITYSAMALKLSALSEHWLCLFVQLTAIIRVFKSYRIMFKFCL